MAQTNVQRRKGGYYYRQRIPADLLIHYGKREIVRSLHTTKKRCGRCFAIVGKNRPSQKLRGTR